MPKLVILILLVALAGVVAATQPAGAAFPGANGKIAFTSERDGNREIYVMDADGSDQTSVTNNPAADSDAAWSPDGTKIAFTSNRDGNSEVYVMNPDGSDQTRLTNNPATDSDAAWSPDGTKIAFTSNRDGNSEVYVMNPDGSDQTRLTDNPAADSDAAWSPDGTKVAFTSNRDGNSEVYVMNPDGSDQTNLTNNSEADFGPDWSPDGTQIAFAGGPYGTYQVHVMNADGSGRENLTNHLLSNNVHPAWSPDGAKIAFATNRDQSAASEVYIKNTDGTGHTKRLTSDPLSDGAPDWQPLVAEPSQKCQADNMSQPTTCAEEDNVNVPVFGPGVKRLKITATHPTYNIGEDNCAADFSGCGAAAGVGAAASGQDVCGELFNDAINVLVVCTVKNWWRGDEEMTVSVGQQALSGHYVRLHRKIEDAPSWPQFLILYQDGNMRLKPHQPPGGGDPCPGSSVIVGPAVPAKRPYVDVEQVSFDPETFSLDITYLGGQSAHLDLLVDRSQATVDVTVGYDTDEVPFATFRSMWVSDGNSDVDHIEAKAGDFPILDGWTTLAGPWWFFRRDVRSTHNTSAPDIRIEVLEQNAKPVGGIAELPSVKRAPLEAPASSGPSAAVLASIIVAGVTAAVTLGAAAWYARRRYSC